MALKPPPITFVRGPSSSTADTTTWKTAKSDTGDFTGLGIPTFNGMTLEQAAIEIEKLATSGSSQWGKIRTLLVNTHSYSGSKNPIFHANWSSADKTAVENLLTQYHVHNLPPAGSTSSGLTGSKSNFKPTPFLSFALDQSKNVAANGYSYSTSAAIVPPIVTVPATADLTKVAQDAFSTTLGRSASPQEAASFAREFQNLVNSYGQAKNDAKKQSEFSAPSQPIQFQQTGQGATPAQTNVPTDTGAIIQPPTASVAAANFAAKTNPVGASAQAAADGLSQFMSMLKGS